MGKTKLSWMSLLKIAVQSSLPRKDQVWSFWTAIFNSDIQLRCFFPHFVFYIYFSPFVAFLQLHNYSSSCFVCLYSECQTRAMQKFAVVHVYKCSSTTSIISIVNKWCTASVGICCWRATRWFRQAILHSIPQGKRRRIKRQKNKNKV